MVVRSPESNQFLERYLLEQQRGSRDRFASRPTGAELLTRVKRRSIHPGMENADI